MKTKLISLFAVFALLVSLTACNEKDFGLQGPENEQSQSTLRPGNRIQRPLCV
jgi:predicted small lipoprotein YifL